MTAPIKIAIALQPGVRPHLLKKKDNSWSQALAFHPINQSNVDISWGFFVKLVVVAICPAVVSWKHDSESSLSGLTNDPLAHLNLWVWEPAPLGMIWPTQDKIKFPLSLRASWTHWGLQTIVQTKCFPISVSMEVENFSGEESLCTDMRFHGSSEPSCWNKPELETLMQCEL